MASEGERSQLFSQLSLARGRLGSTQRELCGVRERLVLSREELAAVEGELAACRAQLEEARAMNAWEMGSNETLMVRRRDGMEGEGRQGGR